MDVSPQDRDLMIRTVIGEAGNQPPEGQAGVASVILNRVNNGGYGDGVKGVVLKPSQFEPWQTRSQELMSYSPDSRIYQNVGKVVDDVITGKIKDPTNGATHFADVDTVKSRGNNSAMGWINGMSNVTKIGAHTFGNADAGRGKMADNVDVDALASKYGGGTQSQTTPDYQPAKDGQPTKITIHPNSNSGVDVDALAAKYGGTPSDEKTPQADNSKPEFWQGFHDPSLLTGTIPRVAVGALRGVKDVVDTGAHGLGNAVSYVADKVLPESMAAPIRQSVNQSQAEDVAGRNKFNAEYPSSDSIIPNATDVGRVVGQVAATAPLMPARAMQAIGGAAGALPTITATGTKIAAPLVNRLGAAAGQGALGGAVFGGATSSQNDKSLAENVGENAIAGAVGGPAVTGAFAGAKALGAKAVGEISPRVAALAKRAESLGIDLKASQVSPNSTFKKYDQVSGWLPFSGADQIEGKQAAQFTRAVSNTFGEDAAEITPELIQRARTKIGGEIESVGKNATVKADTQLGTDLHKILSDAKSVVAENELRPIVNNVKNIVDKIDGGGNISGDAYLGLTNYKATLSKAQNSSNPNIRNAANEIRNALDDALERSIPDTEKKKLLAARAKYKSVMTVKDLADQDPEGSVSPLKLMRKVIQSPGGKLRSGTLGELADIGRQFFPASSDSGTPLGEKILDQVGSIVKNPVSAATAATAAIHYGSPLLDGGLAAAGLATNRLMRKAANGKTVRDAIVRSGTGETHGLANKLANSVAPYSAAIANEPLRLTVYPKQSDKSR